MSGSKESAVGDSNLISGSTRRSAAAGFGPASSTTQLILRFCRHFAAASPAGPAPMMTTGISFDPVIISVATPHAGGGLPHVWLTVAFEFRHHEVEQFFGPFICKSGGAISEEHLSVVGRCE